MTGELRRAFHLDVETDGDVWSLIQYLQREGGIHLATYLPHITQQLKSAFLCHQQGGQHVR